MYIFEQLVEDPEFLAILTHKRAVGRNLDVGLNETQVGTDTAGDGGPSSSQRDSLIQNFNRSHSHIRGRVLPGELLGPDASTCPNIEGIGRFPDRR